MNAPIVRAGRLRCRVQLQTPDVVSNAFGEEVRDWRTYLTTWASIEPVRATERWNAEQSQAETTHIVGMRRPFKQTVRAGDRIVYQGRIFEIEGQPRDVFERQRLLLMNCKDMPPHSEDLDHG